MKNLQTYDSSADDAKNKVERALPSQSRHGDSNHDHTPEKALLLEELLRVMQIVDDGNAHTSTSHTESKRGSRSSEEIRDLSDLVSNHLAQVARREVLGIDPFAKLSAHEESLHGTVFHVGQVLAVLGDVFLAESRFEPLVQRSGTREDEFAVLQLAVCLHLVGEEDHIKGRLTGSEEHIPHVQGEEKLASESIRHALLVKSRVFLRSVCVIEEVVRDTDALFVAPLFESCLFGLVEIVNLILEVGCKSR